MRRVGFYRRARPPDEGDAKALPRSRLVEGDSFVESTFAFRAAPMLSCENELWAGNVGRVCMATTQMGAVEHGAWHPLTICGCLWAGLRAVSLHVTLCERSTMTPDRMAQLPSGSFFASRSSEWSSGAEAWIGRRGLATGPVLVKMADRWGFVMALTAPPLFFNTRTGRPLHERPRALATIAVTAAG